ncbi:MAG: imelysin family protein [Nonlabens sp.]
MKKILLLFLTTLVLTSCDSEGDDQQAAQYNFDRAAFLSNLVEARVHPAFAKAQQELAQLQTATTAYVANRNLTTLQDLRAVWLGAYTAYQATAMFTTGPSERLNYNFQMNVFPTNVADIENNVNNGGYDLAAVGNNDAVGFPAVEYLIYGEDTTDNEVLEQFNDDRRNIYLQDLVSQMVNLTTTVANEWLNSYATTFINSTGNTATSSVNVFINDFIFYYEKTFRSNKIAIPAGVFSNLPLPNRVEGLYSKNFSRQLALESLDQFIATFQGTSFDGTASNAGLDSFLTAVRGDAASEQNLSNQILDQLATARELIAGLDENLSRQVQNDNTSMTRTYDELQKAVVLLKVDMLQSLSISVDFVDADGD